MRIIRTFLLLVLAACASTPRDSGEQIAVLVYNIHAGKDARRVDNLDRVAAVVRDSKADFVLLQEVDRLTTRSGAVDQLTRLRELTGLYGVFGKTLDYQGGEYGIGILSRWPIESDTLTLLPENPVEQRGALTVTTHTPFGWFRVVNTHLDASRPDSFRVREVKEVVRIAGRKQAIGVASVPDVWRTLFVGGDFNSEPDSPVHALVISAGWHDAFEECGKGSGLSFPDDKPMKRIDYLFLPNWVRCTEARVLNTNASDHRPVLVHISATSFRRFASR